MSSLVSAQFTSSSHLVKTKNTYAKKIRPPLHGRVFSHTFNALISDTIARIRTQPSALYSMKNFVKKHPFILLVIGLAVLIMLQRSVVMPLVTEVIKSDAFLVDSKDQGSQLPISTELTTIAFTHCNNYIKSELDSDTAVTFADKPIKAWSMGNYQFLINADIQIADESGKMTAQKYVCRITYDKGDDQEGVLDFDNWTMIGLSGIEGL